MDWVANKYSLHELDLEFWLLADTEPFHGWQEKPRKGLDEEFFLGELFDHNILVYGKEESTQLSTGWRGNSLRALSQEGIVP